MKQTSTPQMLIFVVLLIACANSTRAQETKIKWLGHAAFSITTPNGKVLLIDPWLRNPSNPDGKNGKDPLAAISQVDYILLTHGHRDHVGDAVEIARKTGALLIANPELAELKRLKIGSYEMKPGDTTIFRGRQMMKSQ